MEDEETTPTLPLLCLPDRVLFPGETLPMHIYSPHVSVHTHTHIYPLYAIHTITYALHLMTVQAIQMLRDVATRHKPVAIVTDLRGSSQQQIVTRPTKQELSQVNPPTHTHTHGSNVSSPFLIFQISASPPLSSRWVPQLMW